MKLTIEEIKNKIIELQNDENLETFSAYDFQNYEEEITETKKFLQEKNINNIYINNNSNMGILITKSKEIARV